MDDLQIDQPRRKVFNCIVDDTALVAGVKKTTRDGIRKWINHGAINLLVPLHTLAQLDLMKNGSDRISAEAREAVRWLDDITSNPKAKNAGSVELQGVDEAYATWAEVEQFLLPETLLSMDSEDVASLADSLDKSMSVKEDEEAISSTDSLDAFSQSPSSRRSTNSSTAPDFPPASPGKWNHQQFDEPESSGSGSTALHRSSPVPVALQPLFNHILWRIHADPRAGLSMPDSYVLLTNDPSKQTVSQKFGIRAKRLEQLRDIVAREERDYKNRLLVLRKEATLSESELAARHKAKNSHGGRKAAGKNVASVPEEEEDEIVFRPRQAKSNGQLASPQGPKVFDPNTFARAAIGASTIASTNGNTNANSSRNSNHGGHGNESRRGGNGGRGGSRGNYSHSRANRNSGGPSSPAKPPARPRTPVDLTRPIDPDSFERPAPGARGGRGGRRRLWEAT